MKEQYCFSCEEFGLRLARLRQNKGVSARKMSLDIGQNKNYINSIEAGRNYPNMNSFFEICQYLRITPERFFHQSDVSNISIQQEELIHITDKLPPDKFHHLYEIANDLLDTCKKR